ncbi:hypothetical protein B1729_04160 [Microbacterium sp. B35-04]|nr:hypothetical protein B1729_04160 [Microbacterium sp. B35-04]KAF2418282.1 hypothetical protein B2K11_08705 [Microbacterium sp. B35-30]
MTFRQSWWGWLGRRGRRRSEEGGDERRGGEDGGDSAGSALEEMTHEGPSIGAPTMRGADGESG